ncbi:MAG: bifunctional ADP-dependent NAD(P)H-hydrate dehydratase/NAD(P)H-hydrate epimerase [Myxococcales bacterium]|nr:bifunctional ADP-dependent NAD(P)H-hydrate dehydratase/NAD(P)H-hydrate epimerase [Myxococcales bacterium]
MRGLDAALIHGVGIPSAVLMEHAAHGVADAIVAWWGPRPPPPTRILCGPGNNGGDGYAVARHLHLRGWTVRCHAVFQPASAECRIMHGVARELGLLGALDDAGLVVDAIFGTGQRVPIVLPELPPSRAPIVAIDVPTGVAADTGLRVGDGPRPAFVVAVGRLKPFLFVDALPFALVDIGLEWRGVPAEAYLVDSRPWIPILPDDANKWRRGHVTVRAGTAEKTGAAVLACLGALRGGAGLVTLQIERAAWSRLPELPPEVMVTEPGGGAAGEVLVAGPGLGRGADDELRRLWSEFPGPAVFDADGLRALDGRPSPRPRVITPHAGEAAHLLGQSWRRLEADRLATVTRLSQVATTIYKGACPIVTGEPLAVLPGGTAALGVAGSGDLLAGIVGGLLANHHAGRTNGDWTRAECDAVALAAAWLHQEAARGLPVGTLVTEIAARVPDVRGSAA